VIDVKVCADEGVEVKRSVYERNDNRFALAFMLGEWPDAFEEERLSQVAIRVGGM